MSFSSKFKRIAAGAAALGAGATYAATKDKKKDEKKFIND